MRRLIDEAIRLIIYQFPEAIIDQANNRNSLSHRPPLLSLWSIDNSLSISESGHLRWKPCRLCDKISSSSDSDSKPKSCLFLDGFDELECRLTPLQFLFLGKRFYRRLNHFVQVCFSVLESERLGGKSPVSLCIYTISMRSFPATQYYIFSFHGVDSCTSHECCNGHNERASDRKPLWHPVGGCFGIVEFCYMSVQCISHDLFTEQFQHHLLSDGIYDWSNASLQVMEQLA